ncbi:MliC family protein [Microbulbifer sp. JSM ZJ756]|uniref:MliC family protein n=1 Tax=Microbulbifer sp. JSM ZJ756 TaxID=3376191 RepID=UPI00379632C9
MHRLSPGKLAAPLFTAILLLQAAFTASAENGPSFDCEGVREGSTEAMVCADEVLASLDRKLAEVYAAALAKASNEHPPVLKAGQRGWIKGRNECWKADDQRQCVEDSYRRRIAELQARYRLAPGRGPVTFACDGNPADEVVITYFATEPPTLIAERGDSVSLMYRQPSASGTNYRGRNESFREHGGEATIIWGFDAKPMQCRQSTTR